MYVLYVSIFALSLHGVDSLMVVISFTASHKVPLPRYVGPYNKATGPSAISVMTKHLLAYFTRIALNSTKCNSGKEDVSCYRFLVH